MRGGTNWARKDGAKVQFQSTLPMRGGTRRLASFLLQIHDFNPPSPCGEGPETSTYYPARDIFQSTLPMRGGTRLKELMLMIQSISIHPPHAGRDCYVCVVGTRQMRFQSTLPMRGGTHTCNGTGTYIQFQSTLPMRGGTPEWITMYRPYFISIHPPHAGRDDLTTSAPTTGTDFNPPSPCGEGLFLPVDSVPFLSISIHPPHAGRDL